MDHEALSQVDIVHYKKLIREDPSAVTSQLFETLDEMNRAKRKLERTPDERLIIPRYPSHGEKCHPYWQAIEGIESLKPLVAAASEVLEAEPHLNLVEKSTRRKDEGSLLEKKTGTDVRAINWWNSTPLSDISAAKSIAHYYPHEHALQIVHGPAKHSSAKVNSLNKCSTGGSPGKYRKLSRWNERPNLGQLLEMDHSDLVHVDMEHYEKLLRGSPHAVTSHLLAVTGSVSKEMQKHAPYKNGQWTLARRPGKKESPHPYWQAVDALERVHPYTIAALNITKSHYYNTKDDKDCRDTPFNPHLLAKYRHVQDTPAARAHRADVLAADFPHHYSNVVWAPVGQPQAGSRSALLTTISSLLPALDKDRPRESPRGAALHEALLSRKGQH
ncbi:hypothetical protein CBS101457_003425 [Exobasidium rhododendri]|nr:hypothetical protein CBS101457_003425 [Exobasidium rhododendri]